MIHMKFLKKLFFVLILLGSSYGVLECNADDYWLCPNCRNANNVRDCICRYCEQFWRCSCSNVNNIANINCVECKTLSPCYWCCPNCSSVNDVQAGTCVMCGRYWCCPVCETVNNAQSSFCTGCKCPKPCWD